MMTETELKQILKTEIPAPADSEWFVRKTMNRIPDIPKKRINIFEAIAYGISFILVILSWLWLSKHIEVGESLFTSIIFALLIAVVSSVEIIIVSRRIVNI